jgi:hypothetical protein
MSYICQSGLWKNNSDPHAYCSIVAVSAHPAHVGATGITDFAEGAAFNPAPGYSKTEIPKFAFDKNGTSRNAVVFVIRRAKDGAPLHAIGYELKDDKIDGDVAKTTRPDPKLPFQYETSIDPATGKPGKGVKLRIYTKP